MKICRLEILGKCLTTAWDCPCLPLISCFVRCWWSQFLWQYIGQCLLQMMNYSSASRAGRGGLSCPRKRRETSWEASMAMEVGRTGARMAPTTDWRPHFIGKRWERMSTYLWVLCVLCVYMGVQVKVIVLLSYCMSDCWCVLVCVFVDMCCFVLLNYCMSDCCCMSICVCLDMCCFFRLCYW